MNKSTKSFKLNDVLAAIQSFKINYSIVSDNNNEEKKYSFKSLKNVEPNGIYYVAQGAKCNINSSIIIATDSQHAEGNIIILVEDDPQLVFYKLMEFFFSKRVEAEIHDTAIISDKAIVHPSAYIGPYCVLGECIIDEGVSLYSHVVVMDGAHLSKNVIVESHSTIGATGVAWIWDPKEGRRVKQPQIGETFVGEGTFLGSDISIVRGSVNETTTIGSNCVIAHGSKIGHGSIIGEECHFANNVSIAGNVSLGKRCFLGSGSIVRPNTKLASGIIIGAGAVVVKNYLTPDLLLMGMPAKPVKTAGLAMNGVPKTLNN